MLDTQAQPHTSTATQNRITPMATITRKIDDLDNSVTEDVKTYTVSVKDEEGNGYRFEIDLGKVNGDALNKVLRKFKLAGTEKPFTPAASADSNVSAIRMWAVANPQLLPEGTKIADKGALPKVVKDAYAAHHPEGELNASTGPADEPQDY